MSCFNESNLFSNFIPIASVGNHVQDILVRSAFLYSRRLLLIILRILLFNQEGSEVLIVTFLFGIYLSARDALRFETFEQYISILSSFNSFQFVAVTSFRSAS